MKPVDNGYKFDPDNKGTVELYNPPLDLGNVQTWLQGFCTNLKSAAFVTFSYSCERLDTLFNTLTRSCVDPAQPVCCNLTLPIPSNDFMMCFLRNVEFNQVGRTGFDIAEPIFNDAGELKV